MDKVTFTCVPENVTINDLPDELIVYIARFITLDINADSNDMPKLCANHQSLLKLALCSHRFHKLVEPILYERFHGGAFGFDRLEQFLLRLLERPDLGRRVRFFYWEDILGYSFPVTCFGEDGWKSARNRIMELYEDPIARNAWAESVEEDGLEAIVSLLFVVTPNLEELSLRSCDPVSSAPPVLGWMSAQVRRLQLQKQIQNPAALWKLRNVEVTLYNTGGWDLHHLLQLMTIPTVKIFQALDVREAEIVNFLEANDTIMDNIKDLTVTFNRIDPNILTKFISRFTSLKRLSCAIRLPDQLSYDPALGLSIVPLLLEPQLEDLDITIHISLLEGNTLIQHKLKSFASFQNLRNLRTLWENLVGQTERVNENIRVITRKMSDAIPTSLERLKLIGSCKIAPAIIFELLSQKHRLPGLKYLDLGWWCTPDPDNPIQNVPLYYEPFSKIEALECLSTCQEVGIEMVMRWRSSI